MDRSTRGALIAGLAGASCVVLALVRDARSDVDGGERAGDAGATQASASTPPDPAPAHREGAAIAFSSDDERRYIASEELRSLRTCRMPCKEPVHAVPMPGAPANVLVLPDDRVLVTVREPGLLLMMRPHEEGLTEIARVPVAADAWGLALSPDAATAYVTSAWTHTVTAVDIESARVVWTLAVPREPRGIVAHTGGPIYVSHLVSGALTRIDVKGGVPAARPIALPLSPLRAPKRGPVDGSLGYAMVLSPDGKRLFAARHALGALGDPTWFGAATVDVLLVPKDEPLAPPREPLLVEAHPADGGRGAYFDDPAIDPRTGPIPMVTAAPFSQPRAMVYRRSTDTLIVAGEGDHDLVALDALAPDPTLAVVGRPGEDTFSGSYAGCIAPSGIALSADESTAYVYCRASFMVEQVSLDDATASVRTIELGRDPLDAAAAAGRKLFYAGRRRGLSEDMACSGCHPEGRDDGHVWHEVDASRMAGKTSVKRRIFTGGFAQLEVGGAARQTPMLAGRLESPGPYGWLGEDADLEARITHGTKLHRWSAWSGFSWEMRDLKVAIARLAAFLRVGLVAPPRVEAPLSPEQARGKAIFERPDVGCTTCHLADPAAPAIVTPLPRLPTQPWFDDENAPLKVPSLRFVGGTPPYLHDGSAPTLLRLIEDNRDRMGHTTQLTAPERAALAAYLESL
jgi:DNA-binding beta-propeller fold protein YncE